MSMSTASPSLLNTSSSSGESPGCHLQPAWLSTLSAHRIALIKPSALGDVVQALPVLSALRARFPQAHLAWVVNRSFAPLLEPIAELDEVIAFDREQVRGLRWTSYRYTRDFAQTLRDGKFDLTIDLQGLLRSGLMTQATRARTRLGLATAREGASFFYNTVIDDRPLKQGAVDRYWRVAEALGVGHLSKQFPLHLSPEEHQQARDLIGPTAGRVIALNPGAKWITKQWPAHRFADVAQRLAQSPDTTLLILGGPDDHAVSQVIAQRVPSALNLCGKTSLRVLAAVLSQCDLVVTNDTGPMHLAAAVGTPTVSVFTCTLPERAAPFGTHHRVVQTSVACRGSYCKTCDHLSCHDDVTADLVLPEVDASLAESSPCKSPQTSALGAQSRAA